MSKVLISSACVHPTLLCCVSDSIHLQQIDPHDNEKIRNMQSSDCSTAWLTWRSSATHDIYSIESHGMQSGDTVRCDAALQHNSRWCIYKYQLLHPLLDCPTDEPQVVQVPGLDVVCRGGSIQLLVVCRTNGIYVFI